MANITKTLTSHVTKKMETLADETKQLFDSLQDTDGSTLFHIMEYEDEIMNLSDKLDELRNKLHKKVEIGEKEIEKNKDYLKRMSIIEKMYPFMLYSLVNCE